MKRGVWSAVLALWCFGCVHPGFEKVTLAKVAGAKQYPAATDVVLLDREEVNFFIDPSSGHAVADVVTHRRVRQLKGSSTEHVAITYDNTFSSVREFAACVSYADGTQRCADPSKKSDRAQFNSAELYSNNRVLVFELPPVPLGAVVEYRYVERYADVRPFVLSFEFADRVPVEKHELEVTAPEGWKIGLKEDRSPPNASTRTEAGLQHLTWSREKTAALDTEFRGPPLWLLVPRVSLRLEAWSENGRPQQSFANAAELSSWVYEKTATLEAPTALLTDTVKELLRTVKPEPREQARALYEYVCRRVEYCAIEIGYGGWLPHSPADVHKNRYGDCKDKANYLRALLEVAGISSDVTLIDSHRGFTRPFSFPSLAANFNHAILTVNLPEGPVMADPTERSVPFGLLPARDTGSTMLVVKKSGAEVGTSPRITAAQNVEKHIFTLSLQPDGAVSGQATLSVRGQNAADLKTRVVRGAVALTKAASDLLSIKSLELTEVTSSPLDGFEEEVKLQGKARIARVFPRALDDVALLRLSAFGPLPLPALVNANGRSGAFAWHREDAVTFEYNFTLPASAEVTRLPPLQKISTDALEYALEWKKIPGGLQVLRTLIIKERVVPRTGYAGLAKAVSDVHLAEAQWAVVRFAQPVTR